MLHRSGECSVALLRPNMTTVPKSNTNSRNKTPPSRGFLRLPRVAARASCSLPNAATGHAHRHDAVYVELGFLGLQTSYTSPARANPEGGSRLGSAECDPGTNRGTEPYIPDPNPTPVAGDPNPALTFLPRASAVCPSATSRRMRPREAGRGWASVRPASHVETVVKETTRTVR